MPINIPKNPFFNGNTSEEKIFRLLNKLPNDCIVCHELEIQGRRPDFIVFSPRLGMLVLEVKAWNITTIIDGDQNDIHIKNRHEHLGDFKSVAHPIRQANNYLYLLRDTLLKHKLSKEIVNEDERYKGRLLYPLAIAVVFTNITKQQLNNHSIQQSTARISHERTLLKDEIDDLLNNQDISNMAFEQKLRRFFVPAWQFSLSDRQKAVVRSILSHEPIVVTTPEPVAAAEPQISHAVDFILKQYFSLETEKNRKSEYMSSVTSEINLISKDTSPDIDNTNFINQHSESINRLVSKISQGITESAAHDADELYSHSKAIKLKTEETVIKKTIHDIEKQQQALKSKLSRLASILEVEIA
ncbi:MAG: hypothetical protein BWK73_38990 [Thiothrix lacustris]|uniref:NERD domain-containing protein n=1 Tax=Thiothrix lacustris TaxID=525917 RepID=A0A1Y1QE89_9GAMM|nr:MAG: hypothetical protein BWK73_38990 [Thiothrix lacustris]